MKEETRAKIKEAAQRRSRQAMLDRQAQAKRNAKASALAREQRKSKEEFKVIVYEGPHRTDYSVSSEEAAVSKVEEISSYYKNPFISVRVEIKHCIGFSRKLIHKYEVSGGVAKEIK